MDVIATETRTHFGKNVKKLREIGRIPAVLYGPKMKESASLTVDLKSFEQIYKKAGESTLLDLTIDGKEHRKVLIYDIDHDPIRGTAQHVDFYEVDATKPIEVTVPIIFDGESPAERTLGGVLVKVIHELDVEALPDRLPHHIVVDLSKLDTLDAKIAIGDITAPEGARIIGDASVVIALVEPPKTQEELEELIAAPSDVDYSAIEQVGKKDTEEGAEGEEKSADESSQ